MYGIYQNETFFYAARVIDGAMATKKHSCTNDAMERERKQKNGEVIQTLGYVTNGKKKRQLAI